MYVYYYLFYCYLFKFATCPTSPFAFYGDSVHLQGAKVIILRYFSKYNLKKYAFLPRFLTVLLFFATFCCKLWVYFAHFVNCRFLFKLSLALEEVLHQLAALVFQYTACNLAFRMQGMRCIVGIAAFLVATAIDNAWYLTPPQGSGTHGARLLVRCMAYTPMVLRLCLKLAVATMKDRRMQRSSSVMNFPVQPCTKNFLRKIVEIVNEPARLLWNADK